MPPLSELTPLVWAVLAIGAMSVGITKTALPGLGTVSVALFAAVLPAKASTAALLLVLIVGDMFALWRYRRHADWPTLLRLVPAVLVGLALGAVFLAFASDVSVRRVIGVCLLVLIAFTVWRRFRPTATEFTERGARFARVGYGTLGGFITLVANAGGAVIGLYLIAARFQVLAFLGTSAWFFAVINVTKVPVLAGLGLITADTLLLVLLLIPAVVLGAFIGFRVARVIKQRVFEWIVIGGTVVGALYLLLF